MTAVDQPVRAFVVDHHGVQHRPLVCRLHAGARPWVTVELSGDGAAVLAQQLSYATIRAAFTQPVILSTEHMLWPTIVGRHLFLRWMLPTPAGQLVVDLARPELRIALLRAAVSALPAGVTS